jgi:hypothetical protein
MAFEEDKRIREDEIWQEVYVTGGPYVMVLGFSGRGEHYAQ